MDKFNLGFPPKMSDIYQQQLWLSFLFFFSNSRMNNESHDRTFYSLFKMQIRNQSSLF